MDSRVSLGAIQCNAAARARRLLPIPNRTPNLTAIATLNPTDTASDACNENNGGDSRSSSSNPDPNPSSAASSSIPLDRYSGYRPWLTLRQNKLAHWVESLCGIEGACVTPLLGRGGVLGQVLADTVVLAMKMIASTLTSGRIGPTARKSFNDNYNAISRCIAQIRARYPYTSLAGDPNPSEGGSASSMDSDALNPKPNPPLDKTDPNPDPNPNLGLNGQMVQNAASAHALLANMHSSLGT